MKQQKKKIRSKKEMDFRKRMRVQFTAHTDTLQDIENTKALLKQLLEKDVSTSIHMRRAIKVYYQHLEHAARNKEGLLREYREMLNTTQ